MWCRCRNLTQPCRHNIPRARARETMGIPMLDKPDRPTLSDVARKIGGDWLVPGLEDLARFVNAETGDQKYNFHLDLAMMHHAEFLEFWLQAYGYAEDRFGIEYPDF